MLVIPSKLLKQGMGTAARGVYQLNDCGAIVELLICLSSNLTPSLNCFGNLSRAMFVDFQVDDYIIEESAGSP